jgi:hypothetical protein
MDEQEYPEAMQYNCERPLTPGLIWTHREPIIFVSIESASRVEVGVRTEFLR